MRGRAPDLAQNPVAPQTPPTVPVHSNNTSNLPDTQPASEAANVATTGRENSNLDEDGENLLNPSGQQEPVQVESLTQDTPQQPRPLNVARRGRPFRPGASGRLPSVIPF